MPRTALKIQLGGFRGMNARGAIGLVPGVQKFKVTLRLAMQAGRMRKLILLLILVLTVPTMAKDVMLMNRIGPSKSELYVANSDGSGEHKLLSTPGFD